MSLFEYHKQNENVSLIQLEKGSSEILYYEFFSSEILYHWLS